MAGNTEPSLTVRLPCSILDVYTTSIADIRYLWQGTLTEGELSTIDLLIKLACYVKVIS
jgi:hypothetical protein